MNNIEEESLERFKKECDPETSSCEGFFHYPDDKVFEVGFKHGIEFVNEIIDSRIKHLEGGNELKSMNEMFTDQNLIKELKRLKELKRNG